MNQLISKVNLASMVKHLNFPYDFVTLLSIPLRRWISKESSEWVIYALISSPLFLMLIGSVNAFISLTEIQYRVPTFSFGIGCLYLFTTVFCVKLHKTRIQNFLLNVSNLKSLYTNPQERIEEACTKILVKYAVKLFMILVSMLVTLAASCLYKRDLQLYVMYVCPFCFICDGNTQMGQKQSSFCFNVRTNDKWDEQEEYDKLMCAEFRKMIIAHKALYR